MLDVARVAAALNIALLLVLIGTWARSYLEIRAPMTVGVIVFATLLLAENVVALYFYLTVSGMPSLAVRFMMFIQVLETLGISVLTYFTLQ